MNTRHSIAILVLFVLGCSDGRDGLNGGSGPPGSAGPSGSSGAAGMPGMNGHSVGMVWKDAAGKIIPVVGESVQVDPQGPSVLYFADNAAPGLVWALTPASGAIDVASRIAPMFPSDDCSGASYVYAVSRWTYRIQGTKKLVYFKDDAKPVKIMPQSMLDANGKCVPASSPPDNYFAVSDGVEMMAMEIPTDRWAIPIHAEFTQ